MAAYHVKQSSEKSIKQLWGSSPEIQADSFKSPLLALSTLQNDPAAEEKYLRECMEKIAKDLDEIVFCDLLNCSLVTKDLYRLHLDNFYLEVDRLSAFEDVNSRRIKDFFRILCTERMLTHWAQGAVESFYPIFSFSDEKEQIVTAQKWTHHFLQGVRYFDSLKREGPIDFDRVLSDDTYRHYTKIVMKNFEAYVAKKFQDQTESLSKIVLQDPQLDKKLRSIASRIHLGLPPEDLKYIEFMENMNDSTNCLSSSGTIASIERKKSLLLGCTVHGFALQIYEKSILDDEHSSKLFSGSITIYRKQCQRAFSNICQKILENA